MAPLSKGERTAQRILDRAEALFALKGYRGTTMREIAEAAGIREPGLYNHFTGKEQLFSVMLDRALQPLEQVIDDYLERQLNLETLPSLVTDLLAQHPHIPAMFQQALIAPNDNPGHKLVLRWLENLMKKGLMLDASHPADLQDGLNMLAMFNLTAGFFTAAPLLQRLTGKKVRQSEVLALQKQLCDRLIQQLR